MMTNNNIKSTTTAATTTGATTAVTTAATNKPKVDLKAPIILTERAASRIKEMIKDKDDTVGVKISVKRRGCNGYSYMMNYAQTKDVEAKKDDIVMAHGVTVLVDPKAIFYIVGTVMDYEETDLSTEFTFTNPNSKGECGCGESFNV
jgi:iron-sulfur cluster assembly protein